MLHRLWSIPLSPGQLAIVLLVVKWPRQPEPSIFKGTFTARTRSPLLGFEQCSLELMSNWPTALLRRIWRIA